MTHTVALLGTIAPEVVEAVALHFRPVPWQDLQPYERRTVEYALTSAMIGASPEILDQLAGLRRIVSCGAGLDKFDADLLQRRGIELHHTANVMTADTAELAVALVFALLRRVVSNDAHVRSGEWAQSRPPVSIRVAGKRLGIVGLGNIGHKIAQSLAAVGMLVAYTGPNRKADAPWRYVPSVLDLAAQVDVLVLSCSGGASTRHLVDAAVLQALGPAGYLVNVSRGSVVDEAALIDALGSGEIAGAALDVYDSEPAPDPRFAGFGNVVLQPHAATLTRENRTDLAETVIRLLKL